VRVKEESLASKTSQPPSKPVALDSKVKLVTPVIGETF
jgi:hypothetical protein